MAVGSAGDERTQSGHGKTTGLEGGVAAAISGDVYGTEVVLAFAVARRIAVIAGEELDAELRSGEGVDVPGDRDTALGGDVSENGKVTGGKTPKRKKVKERVTTCKRCSSVNNREYISE